MFSIKYHYLLGAILVLLVQNANSSEYVADLILLEQIQITGSTVSVADVVNKRTLKQALLDVLDKIIIARTPIPGYRKKLSKRYIRKRVKNSRIGNLSQLKVLGADNVVIKRKSKSISAQNYTKKAQHYLYDHLNQHYSNVEVQLVSKNRDIFVPDGNIDISFSSNHFKKANSRMCVMLEFKSDGQFFSRLPVWFKVKAQSEVYVLKTDIAEREQIQIQTLKKIRVDAVNLAEVPVNNISGLGSFITRHAINKGQILTRNQLMPKQDVTRGTSVNVVVTVGNVTLHAKAIARQDGNIGEIVELYNTKNNETFKGIVINENYVRSL